MLSEFLIQNKKEILQLCKEKVLAAAESKPTSVLLDQGLPVFYDELIGVLKHSGPLISARMPLGSGNTIKEGDAAAHGKESLRLGYTISQVVHAYGAVCQSITEWVQIKSYEMTAQEFQDLNLSLDCAIAEAVTEFEKSNNENMVRGEVERLGLLIHELGNSLAAASIAHQMIQKGHVGSAGITSQVLSQAHERMRHLIDSSLTEVRLRVHAAAKPTRLRLTDVISEVEATAMILGKMKGIHLEIAVDPTIQLIADHQLMFSALSNLVNNAIKFTKKNGKVSVRAMESSGRILIEVEDECGGLPDGKTEELFKPFIQKGTDKSGMGLGLSLSLRAVELNQGTLTVRNMSPTGCIFTINLPAYDPGNLPKGEEAVPDTAKVF